MHSGGGKRIIFKKEHNLSFLSDAHSTPPPHPLSLLPPVLPVTPVSSQPRSPHCSVSHNYTQVPFPLSLARTPVLTPHWERESCKALRVTELRDLKLAGSCDPHKYKHVRIKRTLTL